MIESLCINTVESHERHNGVSACNRSMVLLDHRPLKVVVVVQVTQNEQALTER